MVDNTEFETQDRVIHDYVAQQFAAPSGFSGIVIATCMQIINFLPYRAAIGKLAPKPDEHILEVGFGPGSGLKSLHRLVMRGVVYGVDRSTTMLSMAVSRNRAAHEARQLRLRQGSFEKLPLADRSVDGVLAVNILYFVDPLGQALSEAYRVLKPGGRLAIYVTDHKHMSWLQFDGPDTKHIFSKESLTDVLRASEFGADELEVKQIWLPFGFRGLVAVAHKAE